MIPLTPSSGPGPEPGADVSVRPAVAADAQAVAGLQLAAWREVLGEATVATVASSAVVSSWHAAITTPPDLRSRVLVALAGRDVVGFAASTPTQRAADEVRPVPTDEGSGGWTVEVAALEVDPGHRRQGHGSRLLAAVADLASQDGAHHVAAWALRHDTARLAFLADAGLAEVGLRRMLATPGGEVEEILLTAVLGPGTPQHP